MGAGARALFPAQLGWPLSAGPRNPRSRRGSAERRAAHRAGREGDLCLHRAELLPAASGGSPGSIPTVREPAGAPAWAVTEEAEEAEEAVGAGGTLGVPCGAGLPHFPLVPPLPPLPLLPPAATTPVRPWCSTLRTAGTSSPCSNARSKPAARTSTSAGWIWGRRRFWIGCGSNG